MKDKTLTPLQALEALLAVREVRQAAANWACQELVDARMAVAAAHEVTSLTDDDNTKLRVALQACGVFMTPLERLKDWNEYKEDAVRLRNEALGKPWLKV